MVATTASASAAQVVAPTRSATSSLRTPWPPSTIGSDGVGGPQGLDHGHGRREPLGRGDAEADGQHVVAVGDGAEEGVGGDVGAELDHAVALEAHDVGHDGEGQAVVLARDAAEDHRAAGAARGGGSGRPAGRRGGWRW